MDKPSHRAFKTAVYGEVARVAKALASPVRLELLDLLRQAPRSVEALAIEAGISTANASQHLKVLRAARMVRSSKDGTFVLCRLSDDETDALAHHLYQYAFTHLPEVPALFSQQMQPKPSDLPLPIIVEQVRRAQLTLLDVRSRDEYMAGHIAGAWNVPLAELEEWTCRLRLSPPLLTICRGPLCELAHLAAKRLQHHGIPAGWLPQGPADWRAQGIRVEVGPWKPI